MKTPYTIILAIIFTCCIVFTYMLNKRDKVAKYRQAQYDSLLLKDKELQYLIDSILRIEKVIIQRHTHINNKYNENHYTIITAHDSTTKNSLFANLERYEYLHNSAPSQNNQSNR